MVLIIYYYKGYKDKATPWYLNGFLDGIIVTLGQQYNNVGEKPIVILYTYFSHRLGGANPAVNTPRPSRGTRIESCDFIVLIGDP